ncbi:hypothetical protein [Rhodococcus sp. HNM0563]|uniref:LGFP repeat-containing protein n=1 Tax=Rhodococcus sp. HNM0563 TaxID=2716339 RepID=UPI001F1123E5|nr:hypothetical protein [Rhodococcus sp. HNM0563]
MRVRDGVTRSRVRRRMATGVAAAALAVLCLTGGGVAAAAPVQPAADCQTYWPSPFQVCDQIKDLYNSLGGAASPLGFPSSAAQPYGTDGLRQTFTGGAIIWTPGTGAYVE